LLKTRKLDGLLWRLQTTLLCDYMYYNDSKVIVNDYLIIQISS